jgi:phage gp37-like protein
MAVTIDLIEDAIIQTLQQDPTMGAYLKTVESYQGQLEDELLVPHLYPAAFVFFLRGDYRPLSNVEQEADFTFSIILVSQTLRGNGAARRGPPGEPGTYRMLADLRRLMVGQTFGWPDFPNMLLAKEEAIKNTKALSIYDAQYVTRYNVIPLGE